MPGCPPWTGRCAAAVLTAGLLIAWAPEARPRPEIASSPAAEADIDTAAILRARVGPPHPETIAAYRDAGATAAAAHEISEAEWALVERALADLPPLHRRVLEQRLARLSFIDAPSSAGTALTRSFDGPDGEPLFEITLRADVLDKSLSDFLTGKEQMLFADDGSGYSVHVLAGETPALTYLLLHEATHVVDRTLALTTPRPPFGDIWSDYRTLAAPHASGPLGVTAYRRGPRLPVSQAPALYRALAGSPFVSLYSTASAGEDLAELAAWGRLSGRFRIPLTIEVRNAAGQPILTIEPLASPAVRARLEAAEALLERSAAQDPPVGWGVSARP
ncbi:MAG: hypothetical protein V7678_07855 [Brevundimonas sp.]